MTPSNILFNFIFVLSLVLVCIADIVSTYRHNNDHLQHRDLAITPRFSRRSLPSSGTAGTQQSSSEAFDDPLSDSELLDVVLVASVDGKFHALNRTSGQVLWSMPSFAPGQNENKMFEYGNMTSLYPSTLAPLVRTVHPEHEHDENIYLDSDTVHPDDEIYIIEPQSGAIYILPSHPSSSQNPPLRRFPFTMTELVDMSPFSFADPDGHSRHFVGRKETSLLVVELETGKVKASVGGECPWDPYAFQDSQEDHENGEDYELDLDALEAGEDEKREDKVKPTEVYIGRTDYHISIHTRPPSRTTTKSRRIHAPPVQNLSFSTYGPNNQDAVLQASYTRTKDNAYVQSLPTGELMAFRARDSNVGSPKINANDMPVLWFQEFSNPIVATFDVLRRPPAPSARLYGEDGLHTFVLLQPQPSLSDFHPSLSLQSPRSLLPNLDSAYVGIVEETGSLFAMSPKRFPFVAFGGFGYTGLGTTGRKHSIDAAPAANRGGDEPTRQEGDDERELPIDVDEITRQRKLRLEREQREKEQQAQRRYQDMCHSESNAFDLRCLVGVRKLEGGADGAPGEGLEEGRWSRLLDAPPSSNSAGPSDNGQINVSESQSKLELSEDEDVRTNSGQLSDVSRKVQWKWEFIFALLIGLVGVSGVVGRHFFIPKVNIATTKATEVASSLNADATPTANGDQSSVNPVATPSSPTPAVDSESFNSPNNSSPTPPDLVKRQRKGSVPPMSNAAYALGSAFADNGNVIASSASLDEGDDSEGEVDDVEGGDIDPADAVSRRRRTRRKRGKKKKGGAASVVALAAGSEAEGAGTPNSIQNVATPTTPKPTTPAQPLPLFDATPSLLVVPPTPSLLIPTPATMQEQQPSPSSLVVSETVLGFGSHGTVVFRGSLQGRSVAVKRLLRDFVTLASREVSILQESDDHPNVIRYYYQESRANFLYIALELCPGSLADVIESSGDLGGIGVVGGEEAKSQEEWREIRQAILGDPKKALKQITSGLRHLHGLKLVHRDIKPQNILVAAGPGRNFSSSSTSLNKNKTPRGPSYRMLISDFGLCKKLEMDQTSFLPTAQGGMGAGTFGWRAPEILKGEVKLDDTVNGTIDDVSNSSGGTIMGNSSIGSNGSSGSASRGRSTRLTKSVDVFALGCLFHYVLTVGGHPFGDRFEREANIWKGAKNLTALEDRLGEEAVEATDLVEAMLHQDASQRPDTAGCLLHPFFWDSGRRLNFLQEASDRFEIMCRDPKDPHLLDLEKNAFSIVGNDWYSRLDKIFIDNLGKFRKYDGKSVQDLLRALRNKKHHYQDLPNNVRNHLGSMPEGYLSYFAHRYPQLFLHVHRVVGNCELRSESMFRTYYELAE